MYTFTNPTMLGLATSKIFYTKGWVVLWEQSRYVLVGSDTHKVYLYIKQKYIL